MEIPNLAGTDQDMEVQSRSVLRSTEYLSYEMAPLPNDPPTHTGATPGAWHICYRRLSTALGDTFLRDGQQLESSIIIVVQRITSHRSIGFRARGSEKSHLYISHSPRSPRVLL